MKFLSKKWVKIGLISFVLFIFFLIGIGLTVDFDVSYAKMVYDKDGKVLNGHVADDEQWRILCKEEMPEKLSTCLILYEDAHFYYHPGVNPFSIVKSLVHNVRAGKIVRGGSTLTMQVVRLSQGNKKRTYKQKIKEILLALGYDLIRSKKTILNNYGQHAPFGGNIVGYRAAAHKYFGKPPELLTWAEAASLAVLPNAPSQIYPGKGREAYLKKRNFLLQKLYEEEIIDEITLQLALKEDLPMQVRYFDQLMPHLPDTENDPRESNVYTTIDFELQKKTKSILKNYLAQYTQSGIKNICALVVENQTGNVIVYQGNVADNSGDFVDIIRAERSPGSTLKPFLFGFAMDKGVITPSSLIEDVPVFYEGFSPENYNHTFRGLVQAQTALSNSLNIPTVKLLSDFGVEETLSQLRRTGLSTLQRNADNYGLSLILGGVEVRPWELARAYCNLSRKAQNLPEISIQLTDKKEDFSLDFPLTSMTSFRLMNILAKVKRPDSQKGWQYFSGRKQIAWKTGTSYGNRDAWAVGVNKGFTVLAWVGNADGEGRPELTGVKKAAPVMFSIFDELPFQSWFSEPSSSESIIEVCAVSGFRAKKNCPKTIYYTLPNKKMLKKACPYHQDFLLDNEEGMIRYKECANDKNASTQTLFVLPAHLNYYYKKVTGQNYARPKVHPDCEETENKLNIIYPAVHSRIKLPKNIAGNQTGFVSIATSSNPSDTLFWFLNEEYKTFTSGEHKLSIKDISVGQHQLSVVSSSGSQLTRMFDIVED